jgi:hypothetical protein
MNRLAKWVMRLYPARWRRRYGDELDALLADTGADAGIVADLLRGGVRMQFSTWSFAKLAVALGIAGLLLGAAASFLITPIYVSKATFELTGPEPNSAFLRMEPMALSRVSLAGIINVPQLQLYQHELKTRPLEDVIEGMKNDIHIDLVDLPRGVQERAAFRISFQYPDPAKARMVTATLVQKFMDENYQRGLHQVAGKHSLQVVDAASLPVRPFFPDERMILLAGCLPGALIPFVWRRLRRKSIATWGFAVLVAGFGFAGLLAANVLYVYDSWENGPNLLGERYRSTATTFVQNGSPEQIQSISNDAISNTSLSLIVNDPRLELYKEERKTQSLEDVIQNMRRHLGITPSGQYFTLSFEYGDRFKAQQTVNAVVNRLNKRYERTYGSLPDEPLQPAPTVLEVIEAPSTPVLPVSPNRYAIAARGGLAGLFAAGIIATIRRRWNPEDEIPVDAVDG